MADQPLSGLPVAEAIGVDDAFLMEKNSDQKPYRVTGEMIAELVQRVYAHIEQGERGYSVQDIRQVGTSGNIKEYRFVFTDGNESSSFYVYDGVDGANAIPIRATNVSIGASSFVSYTPSGADETAVYNNGYTKRAEVQITNVTSNMYPYITWSVASVEAGGVNILNQYQCYNGGVYVYAEDVPNLAIKALTIECRRGTTA